MHFPLKKLNINLLIVFVFAVYSPVFAQNTINGKWEAQTYSETCWAAALANVSNVSWISPKQKKNENFYLNRGGEVLLNNKDLEYTGDVYLDTFYAIIGDLYKFRYKFKDTVLTYDAINHYLRYKYPRPLIYGYNYENEGRKDSNTMRSGHFTNIIGCKKTQTIDNSNKYWLKIFDPKPDGIGTNYLKNYESYARVIEDNYLQSTFYTFVGTKKLPKELIDSISLKTIDRKPILINKICDLCVPLVSLIDTVNSVIKDSIFYDYIGQSATVQNDFMMIPVINLLDSLDNVYYGLNSVKNENKTSLLFTKNKQINILGGVLVREYNSKYLIERVENLTKYQEFEDYLKMRDTKMFIIKDGFRLLRFIRNDSLKFIDLDNIIGNSNKNQKIFNFQETISGLKPHYLKLTVSAKMILKSCQRIIDLKKPSLNVGEGRYFMPSSMKYSDFFENSNNSIDTLSFMFSKDIGKSDAGHNYFTLFFHSKDTLRARFNTYVPKEFIPKNIYSFSDENANYNEYQLLFIPVSKFPKIKNPENIDLINKLSKYAIKIEDISKMSEGRIECSKGVMNSKYAKYYQSKKFANGIICDLLMTDGQIITCYLVTRNSNNTNKIQWKE